MPATRDLEKELVLGDTSSNLEENIDDSISPITTTTVKTIAPVMKTSADQYVELLYCLPLFDRLPAELVLHIAHFINGDINLDYASMKATKLMASISRTNKSMHGFFKSEMKERGANYLLTAVLHGNENLVSKMAKSSPHLFFIKSTAQDYAMDLEGNRRTIEDWSPYQAMFGTGDAAMLARVKPDLDAYLAKIPNGDELAHNQEQEKFPDGLGFSASKYDFTPLVNAITHDQNIIQTGQASANTLELLKKFRADFKPGIVKTGHHFNMSHLIKAHAIYYQKQRGGLCLPWGDKSFWDAYQLDFFSVFVIGFLQRLLTTFYMQIASQGFFNQHKPLDRLMSLRKDFRNVNYRDVYYSENPPFPLDDTKSNCRLGLHFLVDSYDGGICQGWGYDIGQYDLSKQLLLICRINTWELSTFKHTLPQKQDNALMCVIS